jgi:hypothetical protein
MPDESGLSPTCSQRQRALAELNKPAITWHLVVFCIALVLIVSFVLGYLIDPLAHWL